VEYKTFYNRKLPLHVKYEKYEAAKEYEKIGLKFPAELYHKTFSAGMARFTTYVENIQFYIHNGDKYLLYDDCPAPFRKRDCLALALAYKFKIILNHLCTGRFLNEISYMFFDKNTLLYKEWPEMTRDIRGIIASSPDIYQYTAEHFIIMAVYHTSIKRELIKPIDVIDYIQYITGGNYPISDQLQRDIDKILYKPPEKSFEEMFDLDG
jgi:hypothetical protein